MNRSASIALAWMCLGASSAFATQIAIQTTTCPLDGASVKVFRQLSTNTHGGYDSDLCAYASNGQWRSYAVTTCEKDLFSLLSPDFDVVRDEATTAKLLKEAQAIRSENIDIDALKPWERQALATRFYRAMGKDDATLGELTLTSAWLARDEAVGVYEGLDGPVQAIALLDAGDGELERSLTVAQRKSVLYNLARIAHRAGENARRRAYLEAFERLTPLDDAERAALSRMRKMTTEIEPFYQDQAIALFRSWLNENNLPVSKVMRISYVLADSLRRRDRFREAFLLYAAVAGDEGAPQQLRELSIFLADHIAERAKR
jgi:hypothetical protein